MKKRLPIFSTPEGHAQYVAAYEAMFDLWPVPHEPVEVKTSFGLTHINVSGPGDGYPLVLLHAAGLSSTVWFAYIAGLSARHRVYAVDVISDAGKSVADRLLVKREDYAQWLKEVLDGLNIDKCHMLGHSYGGWLTLNMVLAHPERLQKIVLLAPAASFRPLSLLTKLFFFLGNFKIGPSARSVLNTMAAKGTVLEEPFIQLMEEVTRYCTSAIMFPTVFTDDELKQIDLPVLLIIGAKEKIYHLQKAIERAQRCLPDLTTEIIPEAGHLLIMDQPEFINTRILTFL